MENRITPGYTCHCGAKRRRIGAWRTAEEARRVSGETGLRLANERVRMRRVFLADNFNLSQLPAKREPDRQTGRPKARLQSGGE